MAVAIAEPPHLAADLKARCLSTVAAQWQPLAEQAVRQRQAPADYLAQLVHLEVTARRERRIQRHIQDAPFPMLKTLDAFSFEAQPDLNRDAVLQTNRRQLPVGGRETEPRAGIRQEGRPSLMPTRAVGPISMTVCSPTSRRVRFAPPPLRGADGLDAGCAHGPGSSRPTARERSGRRGPKSDVWKKPGWSPSHGHGGPVRVAISTGTWAEVDPSGPTASKAPRGKAQGLPRQPGGPR